LQTARNYLAGLSNSIWSALVTLAVVPFYLKYLGIEAYGLVGFLVFTQGIVQLLDVGLGPTIGMSHSVSGAAQPAVLLYPRHIKSSQAWDSTYRVSGIVFHRVSQVHGQRMVAVGGEGCAMMPRRSRPVSAFAGSAFRGFRFPPEVIVLAVRWYLRFGLSYRDVEELLAEHGIDVDHVTVFRWVQRFTPLLADAARLCRHAVGDRWFVDETYVKVAGRWRYVYRAIDQYGQIIDVYVSARRDTQAARRLFTMALRVWVPETRSRVR
jgi:hypothetical protein